jgi:hypothetical protein
MSSILCEVTDDGKYCEYADHIREMKRVKGALRLCIELLFAAGYKSIAAAASAILEEV